MDQPTLTGAQRSRLRGLGQRLPDHARVGRAGITPAFLAELRRLLLAHELVKLRFTGGDRAERAALGERIAAEGGCACVGAVGHTALFYRPHPDPAARRLGPPDATGR